MCAECKVLQDLNCFANNKVKSDGKSDKCRACKKAYNIEYYKKTKHIHNPGRAKLRDARRKELRDYVWNVKRSSPCEDCRNYFHPFAMDFDHVFGEKYLEIAEMVKLSKSIELIEREIAKCELVCAVCHRLRTAYRLGIITKEETNMRR